MLQKYHPPTLNKTTPSLRTYIYGIYVYIPVIPTYPLSPADGPIVIRKVVLVSNSIRLPMKGGQLVHMIPGLLGHSSRGVLPRRIGAVDAGGGGGEDILIYVFIKGNFSEFCGMDGVTYHLISQSG